MPDLVKTPRASEVGYAMVPGGMTLDTLLGAGELPDEPIDMTGWDHLMKEGTTTAGKDRLAKLNAMFEAQAACDTVLRNNGPAALRTILQAIAQASSAHRVPMGERIRTLAEFYGYAVA